MSNKKFRFMFHYSKPESLKAGEPRLSIHYKKACHIVNSILCAVPVETHNQKQQPRCVLRGWAKEIHIEDGRAVIT